jgi:hypothetical protein
MYIPSYSTPFPVYQPAMRVIDSITKSDPVTITTTINHQYISGLIVRIDIPYALGMQQLNQQTGTINVTGPTTFTMPIDTTNYDSFVLPNAFPPGYQDAQVVPIGEINSILYGATRNVLPYSAT